MNHVFHGRRAAGSIVVAFAALTLAVGLAGCGKTAPQEPPPLSLADWKTLPPAQKYDDDVLDRLKRSDSKWSSDEAWDAFTRSVIVPSRRRDFPAGKRRS